MRALLDMGADAESSIFSDFTVLACAISKLKDVEIARMLIEAGADIDRAKDCLAPWGESDRTKAAIGLLDRLQKEYAGRKFRKKTPAQASTASKDQERIVAAENAGDDAEKSGEHQKAIDAYATALKGPWSDDEAGIRVRGKYLKLVGGMPQPPELPEEAHRYLVRGQVLIKEAKSEGDFQKAADELTHSLEIAPWWPATYFNLGLTQEKSGDYREAMQSLKYYLLAQPNADDARAVQDKIYGLELKAESPQTLEEKSDAPQKSQRNP